MSVADFWSEYVKQGVNANPSEHKVRAVELLNLVSNEKLLRGLLSDLPFPTVDINTPIYNVKVGDLLEHSDTVFLAANTSIIKAAYYLHYMNDIEVDRYRLKNAAMEYLLRSNYTFTILREALEKSESLLFPYFGESSPLTYFYEVSETPTFQSFKAEWDKLNVQRED